MRRFEYMTIAIEASSAVGTSGKVDYDLVNARLNVLGQDGWELVAVDATASRLHGETRDLALFLKRENS